MLYLCTLVLCAGWSATHAPVDVPLTSGDGCDACAQVTTYKVISSRKGTVQKMAPPNQASIPEGEQVRVGVQSDQRAQQSSRMLTPTTFPGCISCPMVARAQSDMRVAERSSVSLP